MKTALLLSFLIAFTSCKAGGGKTVTQGARAPAVAQNLPFKWDNTPLSLLISEDFVFNNIDEAQGEQTPVDDMKHVWDNAVPDKILFTYPSQRTTTKNSDSLGTYKDQTIGIYISNSWFPSISRDALAITQFFAIKSTSANGEYYSMRHADIIINKDFYTFSYDAGDISNYDMNTVLLHEIGHLLGLKHEANSSSSIMKPYLRNDESNRVLDSIDEQNIRDKYSDNQTTSTASASFLPSGIPDGHLIHGIIELRANGECKHFYNGELKKTHFSF